MLKYKNKYYLMKKVVIMSGQYIKDIIDIILKENIVTKKELQKAIKIQEISGINLEKVLINEGLITEQQFFDIMKHNLDISDIRIGKLHIDPEIIRYIPEYFARRHIVFPIKKQSNTLTIAMNNPLNILAIDDLKITTGLNIKVVMAKKSEIQKAINDYYSTQRLVKKDLKTDNSESTKIKSTFRETSKNKNSSAVDIIDMLIHQAIMKGASDIHIEPQNNDLRIRYRIDGNLSEVMSISKSLLYAIVSRIKVLSKMDIDIKLRPQDGHMTYYIENNKIDIRVSTLPTINGEKVVLRILNRDESLLSLGNLGFSKKQQKAIYSMLTHSQGGGVILVVGPTGSGKTTTLYSMLCLLNSSEKNIVTLEDPVEYELKGINQIQVNPKAGITFANGLRSILRQDPDIIMVGEIRDIETAEIVIRAALTGHLVISTLHTNTASGAITRLIDMGIEPYLLSSSIVGIIAQRLVRKLCPYCKQPYKMTDIDKQLLNDVKNKTLYKETGCLKCNYIGFKGRTVIGEMVTITPDHKKLINSKAPVQLLDKVSLNCGFENLKQNAAKLISQGVTTTKEVIKQSI